MTTVMFALFIVYLWTHDVGENIGKIADSLKRIADAIEDNEVDEDPDDPNEDVAK